MKNLWGVVLAVSLIGMFAIAAASDNNAPASILVIPGVILLLSLVSSTFAVERLNKQLARIQKRTRR